MVDFSYKKFNELTSGELHDIFALRLEVFVVEQDCIYQDIDGKDKDSVHVLGLEEGKIIAYARILKRGFAYKKYNSIGRIVVSEDFRSRNIGHELVKFSIEVTKNIFPKTSIKISAQAHLQKFYEKHKFQISGHSYLEDGIPHIRMILLER
tara:strand:+ start:1279 stop:1731 length:453 start_codon:yes stop_codon:yes gene_type:complete